MSMNGQDHDHGPSKQRDTFRDRAYWDATVRQLGNRIDEYAAILASGKYVRNQRLRLAVLNDRLALLSAQYSRGEAVASLRPMFPPIIDALAAYRGDLWVARPPFDFSDIDQYVSALWLVALAVLLDADHQDVRRLVDVIDQEGKDAIFDRLVALRIADRLQATGLLYPRPYEYLLHALDEDGAERERLIGLFLRRYYRGMRHTGWYDMHLRPEPGGFAGYWCFELAAFVKGLSIPNQAFADNVYYPRDLVTEQ